MRAISDWLEEAFGDCEDVVVLHGWDKHIIGRVSRFGQPDIVLYDREGILSELCVRDGMTREDAEEFFAFNIGGAWFGETTPAFLVDRAPRGKRR